VLYEFGANSGGLTLYMDNGVLVYEYNLFIIERTKLRSSQPLPAGRHKLEVITKHTDDNPRGAIGIKISLDGTQVIDGIVPRVAALLFTANDCLDVGQSLGSAVSMDYRERAPFKFNGTIHKMNVDYTD